MNPKNQLPNLSLVKGLQLANVDERRSIKDVNLPHSNYNVITVTGSTGPLGNHYHKNKTEDFLVWSGGGTLTTTRVDKYGHPVSESEIRTVEAGECIYMPPFHYHVFELEVGTVLITHSSAPFNNGATTNEDKDFWPLVPVV